MLLPKDIAERPLAVSTTGLCKRFGAAEALKDANLTVPTGGAYLLAGANGSGKSTLLKSLVGLVRPDGGSIDVCGNERCGNDVVSRASIGFAAEDPNLGRKRLRVDRWLAYHARYYPAWDKDYAASLGAALSLPLSRSCDTLSQSEIRRCWLIMALGHRPPVLLLDEPLAGLDPLMRDIVLAILSEHIATGDTTLVIASHEAAELAPLMNHIGILSAGRFVLQAPLQQVRKLLRRYRVHVSASWMPDPSLLRAVVHHIDEGVEAEWTLWGDERQFIADFEAAGAVVRAVTELSVPDAIRVLLRATPSTTLSDV